MIRVYLTDAEVASAEAHGKWRSASMGHVDTKNSQNFFPNRPGWFRHSFGSRHEHGYAKEKGFPIDWKTIGRGDRGFDFPDGADVKGTGSKPALLKVNVATHERLVREVELYRKVFPKMYVLSVADYDRPHIVDLIGFVTWERWLAERHRAIFQYRRGPVDQYYMHAFELDPLNRQAGLF